jgi:hypothetical protein
MRYQRLRRVVESNDFMSWQQLHGKCVRTNNPWTMRNIQWITICRWHLINCRRRLYDLIIARTQIRLHGPLLHFELNIFLYITLISGSVKKSWSCFWKSFEIRQWNKLTFFTFPKQVWFHFGFHEDWKSPNIIQFFHMRRI